MVEIIKSKNSYKYDVFEIKTNKGSFEISLHGDKDLYWRYVYNGSVFDSKHAYVLEINKENYFLYQLFDDLYNSIVNNKNYDNSKLVKNNIIDWHSDDLSYKTSSCLLIEKQNEIFRLGFIKSKKSFENGIPMTFSVKIANKYSRYNPYNVPFMNFYNELKEYNLDYNQISMEEFLDDKKLSKTRN